MLARSNWLTCEGLAAIVMARSWPQMWRIRPTMALAARRLLELQQLMRRLGQMLLLLLRRWRRRLGRRRGCRCA